MTKRRELFAHVAEMSELRGALLATDKYHDFLEMAQGYFARAIDQRLAKLPGHAPSPPRNGPPWRMLSRELCCH
jgi:hypothetical protein